MKLNISHKQFRQLVPVIVGLLFSPIILADTLSSTVARDIQQMQRSFSDVPGGMFTDRPNAHRPGLPGFVPDKSPGFQLPPVEDRLIPRDNISNQKKMRLKSVEFIGNTVVSNKQLQLIAQAYIAKPVAMTDLEDLRQQISKYYIDQGYVNSGAIIPSQKIQNGILRIEIIEGKLSHIRVTGTGRLNPDYVADRLQRNPDAPLNKEELSEKFQLLLLDPMIERMKGSLTPGNRLGESILNVDVTRKRPFQLWLDSDNYRSPSIGSTEGRLSGWVRNLTSFGDIVEGSIFGSEGSLGGQGGFSIPLNRYDTRFGFHFYLNDANIIQPNLKTLDIKSNYVAYDFSIIQPLIQKLNRNLNIGIAFNVKNNRTTYLQGIPFPFSRGATANGITNDSVLRLTLDYVERFEHHVFSARSTTSVGINAFNANWKTNGIASGNFVAWLGQFQYAGQLFEKAGTLLLRADGQYTDNNLLTMESYAIGGRYSVRGYRENQYVSDKGYTLSVEYRYPLINEISAYKYLGQITLFPFMDYGQAKNRGEKTNSLYSMGVGVEWQPNKYVNTEILYAYAILPAPKQSGYNLQDSGVEWRVTLFGF